MIVFLFALATVVGFAIAIDRYTVRPGATDEAERDIALWHGNLIAVLGRHA